MQYIQCSSSSDFRLPPHRRRLQPAFAVLLLLLLLLLARLALLLLVVAVVPLVVVLLPFAFSFICPLLLAFSGVRRRGRPAAAASERRGAVAVARLDDTAEGAVTRAAIKAVEQRGALRGARVH